MSKLFLTGFLTSALRALVSIFQYNVYSHQLQKKKCLQRIIIYVNYKLHTIKFAQIFNSVVTLKKKKKNYIFISVHLKTKLENSNAQIQILETSRMALFFFFGCV